MDHVGFALGISALAMGALCGLYRQYVIMLVTAFILAALMARDEAVHHWMQTFLENLVPMFFCSALAAHIGFLVTRWIPALSNRKSSKPAEPVPTAGESPWKTLG